MDISVVNNNKNKKFCRYLYFHYAELIKYIFRLKENV